jgi:AcrR family transcriptional regulator
VLAKTATPQRAGPTTTEAQIYEAALAVIAERGYHGMTLRQVAGQVGIQMASLYYYYDSKQAMLVDIMDRTMRGLAESVQAAVDPGASAEERLRQAIRGYVLFHANNRAAAFVTDAELRALEPRNHRKQLILRDAQEAVFLDLVTAGIASREFPLRDAKLFVFCMLTACTGVAAWFRPGQRLSAEQIADGYGDIFAGFAITGSGPARPSRRNSR